MEKQKRWQLYLILAVILLTIYNVLPTLFYYANPLKKSIGEKEAVGVAHSIIDRVNHLEEFTLSWLRAQSKNLGLKPVNIALDPHDPRLATITFRKAEEAAFFAKTLYRAGVLIPFVPAQLAPGAPLEEGVKTVVVQRRIGVHLDPQEVNTYFHFIPKVNKEGLIAPEYRELVNDRALQIAIGLAGESPPAHILKDVANETSSDDEILRLARNIVEYENAFGDKNPITQRYYASFTQGHFSNKSELIHKFTARIETLLQKINKEISTLKEEQTKLKGEGKFLTSVQQQTLEVAESQKNTLGAAAAIVKRNASTFAKGLDPINPEEIIKSFNTARADQKVQKIELEGRNPFISSLTIDWNNDQIQLNLQPEVAKIRALETKNELEAIQQEKLNQFLFNDIATVARSTDETISPSLNHFVIALNKLTNSSTLLAFDLGAVAAQSSRNMNHLLTASWQPTNPELSRANYPIFNWSDFSQLSAQERKLGLVIYAPAAASTTENGFRRGSIYIIARGLNTIKQKYQDLPAGPERESFERDFRSLQELLRQNGFIGYLGGSANLPSSYHNDYIFELSDYYSYLLAATREDFSVRGSKKVATLEFTDVEQRLLTLNKIETREHEDLLKWRDEYHQARVSIDSKLRYDIPAPTQSVLWDNIKLSARKYFRGDDRKILKWGLDLSGGKTVRIGLRDQNNQPITAEDDLRQAVNELYQRVNRLGVSEVGIRIEGPTIVLDFPGSQGLAASELIQASAMYFHVVNEKFTANNPLLREAVNAFLEDVWNEAVITNRTDPESLNEIAWIHLGGSTESEEFHPLSSHAQLLVEHGLRFANPKAGVRSNHFDDSLSAIAVYRSTDFADWQGQAYPLLIIFRNYALEGSNLIDVHTGYDPSEGNMLSFGVSGSFVNRFGERVNPRDDFYAWTSRFSEEKIASTPLEAFSQGKGWRMAVLLNGSIVSAPVLNSPLRDNARISGHFSQREINQLAADLKAGSLSFTPHILSEENVSPDLGKEQRFQGIMAAVLGLFLVIAVMCLYYRFSGIVASVAVLFNLLIIWGILQNLGAALTLPGIAGIILAVGMSIDANVLVFERIREEFALTKRLPAAIQAGYRKAFSAIIDSNLTTILAALILLNFDSGPIKGFALTLIIGIVSSMFTSLFMTRFFFAGWVQNPKHKELKMMQFFGKTQFNFLSRAKLAITLSIILVLVGAYFLVKEWQTIFGMDFTGGYALTIELQEKPNTNYRLGVEEALAHAGAFKSDFKVQELNKPNQLRIQLGTSMEQPGKPFYEIDQILPPVQQPLFAYQAYPQIMWIVNALHEGGLELNPETLPQLNLHWTEMSGQLSQTMRNQALFGLAIALLGILIYITFRFEFKYAMSATIGLVHDILITVGLLAIGHFFFENIQIDLQVIAALMTIVGYSLNDTIIIFDRIREDLKHLKKMPFTDIVNHALNATLSRTVMTSGTTLLVLLALVLFGGPSIFSFALIMTVGIAIGTLSSLFVAAPMLLYFHTRGLAKEEHTTLERAS